MSLSCDCNYEPDGPGDWWFYPPEDFCKFEGVAGKRKRCISCNELIDIGSDCLIFTRERNPWTEIEEKIKGEIVAMPPLYMCEKCGEIFLNLSSLGYCVGIDETMQEALHEYHLLSGFKREAYDALTPPAKADR